MVKTNPNVLLVEGKEEKRVIPQLLEANGIQWVEKNAPVVFLQEYDGVENMLKPGEIDTQLKTPGLRALGVLVDADDDAERRWQQIRARCDKFFSNIPSALPQEGLVVENDDKIRLGVWIMPDNRNRGMLETFLAYLRPDENEPLLRFTREACDTARALGAPCIEKHVDKAQIYAWLAWQDPPGRQLHQAIMARMLKPTSPQAAPFVRWFRDLFSV